MTLLLQFLVFIIYFNDFNLVRSYSNSVLRCSRALLFLVSLIVS